MNDFRTITHEEARALLADGRALALDVRTPGEYEGLGHIPGAWLMPVDLVASAPAVLPDDGRPILVYCEHGVRSVARNDRSVQRRARISKYRIATTYS